MEHEIEFAPTFTLLTLSLEPGETVRTEAGSMVSYDDGIDIETSADGGLFGSLKRSLLGGESFFQNTFTAREAGEVALAPPLPGDIADYHLDDETLFVQSGSYLASGRDVELDTQFGGGRSFFGGEGLFLLRLDGTGPAFLSSYGAVREVELAEGERYTVDTGHIVAFESTTTFDVRAVGGFRSTLFSGEGLVCEFEGPGRVWTQTRSPDALLTWLIPKLPTNASNAGSSN
ncbi:TIGR00266 family protein [Haloprofundus salinisoli]|uniref:TIGR00266 family protein n=1 Tax=Haloprofundus salinisoli TaxID=2876193 RepID=UPI001CD0022A|nr:TIGR00266 family protein [Haloprofundus salinisoli]